MRPLPLLALLLLASCAGGDTGDLVLYSAPSEESGDLVHTRTLLVTAAGPVLGVEKRLGVGTKGECVIWTGTVDDAEWSAIRDDMLEARHLAKDTAPPDFAGPLFQLYARIGDIVVNVTRDPASAVETDVAAARERLEAVWEGLARSDDPVAALTPFLGSIRPQARGQAVIALLSLRRSESASEAVRAAATRVLAAHVLDEPDTSIRERIQQELKQNR